MRDSIYDFTLIIVVLFSFFVGVCRRLCFLLAC